MQPCGFCSAPIPDERIHTYGQAVIYCGGTCSLAARRAREKQRYRTKRDEVRAALKEHRILAFLATKPTCPGCNLLLPETLIRAARVKFPKFCGEECAKSARALARSDNRKVRLKLPTNCKQCQTLIERNRVGKPPKYCSPACEEIGRKLGTRTNKCSPGFIEGLEGQVSLSAHGTALALIAEADLLRRGWHTFRATCPQVSPFDFVAYHRDFGLKRIEVRAGHKTDGVLGAKFTLNPKRGRTDVYAVVLDDLSVRYFDEEPLAG